MLSIALLNNTALCYFQSRVDKAGDGTPVSFALKMHRVLSYQEDCPCGFHLILQFLFSNQNKNNNTTKFTTTANFHATTFV